MRSTVISFLAGITIAAVVAIAVTVRRPAEPPASVLVARSDGREREAAAPPPDRAPRTDVDDPAERALAEARREHARATAASTPVPLHAPEVASLLPHDEAPIAARTAAVAPSDTVAPSDSVAPPDANGPRPDAETSGASPDEFDGWWLVTNSVDETSHPAYVGLRVGYRVHLHREGDRVSGRGYKWTENGRRVSPSARTPIFVSGIVRDGHLQVRFVEHGTERVTEGRFRWQLSRDAAHLRGSFASTAADSSGRSEAHRVM